MNKLAFFLIIAISLLGCTKDVATAEVTYTVTEVSPDLPTYGIEFTSDAAGSTAVASRDGSNYTSGKIVLEQGQFISMKTTCNAPVYQLRLSIFINGNLWKTGEMNNPTTSITVSGNIPTE